MMIKDTLHAVCCHAVKFAVPLEPIPNSAQTPLFGTLAQSIYSSVWMTFYSQSTELSQMGILQTLCTYPPKVSLSHILQVSSTASRRLSNMAVGVRKLLIHNGNIGKIF